MPESSPTDKWNCRVVTSTPLKVTGLYRTWVDTVEVKSLAGDPFFYNISTRSPLQLGPNYLRQALDVITNTQILPDIGQKHPNYISAYCVGIDISPMPSQKGPSPVSLRIDVTWFEIDKLGYEAFVDNYQTSEIRNYDINGNPTYVYYKSGAAGNAGPLQGIINNLIAPRRVADIRVPRITHGLRIVHYEDQQGSSLGQLAEMPAQNPSEGVNLATLPIYNSDAIWGFPPCTLLYIGRREAQAFPYTPIFHAEYSFLVNDRGWDKFFAVFTNSSGLVPSDVANISPSAYPPGSPIPAQAQLPNGLGIFNMIQAVNFNNKFKKFLNVRDTI